MDTFLLRLKPDTIGSDAIVQRERRQGEILFNQFMLHKIDCAWGTDLIAGLGILHIQFLYHMEH